MCLGTFGKYMTLLNAYMDLKKLFSNTMCKSQLDVQIFIFQSTKISSMNLERMEHTITYKSRLTQTKLYKKRDAIFSIYERNGIMPWHFFKFSLRPFEVVEVKWQSASKFWGCDLEIWQSFLKDWLLTSKR